MPANPLATINANDIASIEILKDASATSIYGARGANGVIIITTIDSGLVRYGVNPNYSEFVTGVVILFAIGLDRIVKRRRAG